MRILNNVNDKDVVMILRDMEADDPRWAENPYIPHLHAHLQAAKNGREFDNSLIDGTWKRIQQVLHCMKKVSYFAIILFVISCIYFIFLMILTSHPVTAKHQTLALQPTTKNEKAAFIQAQAEQENIEALKTEALLTPLMTPQAAENAVLNNKNSTVLSTNDSSEEEGRLAG